MDHTELEDIQSENVVVQRCIASSVENTSWFHNGRNDVGLRILHLLNFEGAERSAF
ncbi:hypothetical protein MGN70_012288 [Eutypa lata]|nr:hypothetical protein MGN70_012288 [Eutypa lata]